MKRILSLTIALLVLSVCVCGAAADNSPMAELKGPVEKGIALLKDPQYRESDKKEEQREEIWRLVKQVFDFEQISMRALAREWRNFKPDQRKAFVEAFTELLKNTYMDKIQGEFHDEEVVFESEDLITDNKAEVKSKIIRGGKLEIPIDYSLYKSDAGWRVYDVKIEGVSMVKNYRSQFKSILAKDSPDDLIQRLIELNDKHEKDRRHTD